MSKVPPEEYSRLEKQILDKSTSSLQEAAFEAMIWGDIALDIELDSDTAAKFYTLAKQYYRKLGNEQKVTAIEREIAGADSYVANQKARIARAEQKMIRKFFPKSGQSLY